jgi:hypothetical protein
MSNEQKVRELAYLKWEKAGYPAGDGVQFWTEAEQELAKCKSTAAKKTPAPTPSKVAAKRSPAR